MAKENLDLHLNQKTLKTVDNLLKRIYSNIDFHSSKKITTDLSTILFETKEGNYFASEGLLNSIISRIIIEDGDILARKFSALNDKSKRLYRIFPSEVGYALQSTQGFTKEWSQAEIRDIVYGRNTISGNISVAEALIETIGEFGKRTHDRYYGLSRNLTYYARRDALISMVQYELSQINRHDPSKALIKAFQNMLTHYSDENLTSPNQLINPTQEESEILIKLKRNVEKFKDIIKSIDLERNTKTSSISESSRIISATSYPSGDNEDKPNTELSATSTFDIDFSYIEQVWNKDPEKGGLTIEGSCPYIDASETEKIWSEDTETEPYETEKDDKEDQTKEIGPEEQKNFRELAKRRSEAKKGCCTIL